MIYLSGSVSGNRYDGPLRPGWGLMATPDNGLESHLHRGPWAADNGVFGCWTRGVEWTPGNWWSWLRARNPEGCLFAVAPDVVGDAAATRALLSRWSSRIRLEGFPVAFAAQDGVLDHLPDWTECDWVFIGGTDAFKESAEAVTFALLAMEQGKRVHWGRVNSHRRYRFAQRVGAASCDGTFVAFGPDVNVPKVDGWLSQAMLPSVTTTPEAPGPEWSDTFADRPVEDVTGDEAARVLG